MPRGDLTGPVGMGAMTGRGAGYCRGYGMPGYAGGWGGGPGRMGMGRGGFGAGVGGGFGRRHRFYATGMPSWRRYGAFDPVLGTAPYQKPDPEVEKQLLERQAEALQAELEMIRKRLAGMADDDTVAG